MAELADEQQGRELFSVSLGGDHGRTLGGATDLPTVGDFLPVFDASACYGVGGPRKKVRKILDTTNPAALEMPYVIVWQIVLCFCEIVSIDFPALLCTVR
jgi:hypothetical protein